MSGLSVENLSFTYGTTRALEGVGFRVEPGRFCALLGPNGAGKSTLFSILTRLFSPREGRIEVMGHDLTRQPRRALAQMGVVFQQPTLDLDLSVRRNLSYYAALQGLAGRATQARLDAVLDLLHMRERGDERVRDLNGGHRRRTEIARSLIHDPAVLLLDEPTVGLDAATRVSITDHLHELSKTHGKTVLWTTHLADEVRDDDQLIILHRGRVLQDGRCGTLRAARPLADHFLLQTSARAPCPSG